MIVPFFIEAQAAGEVLVFMHSEDAVYRVRAPDLLEQLREWMDERELALIASKSREFKGVPTLRAQDLSDAGLVGGLDEQALELRLSVPPALRKTNLVYIGGRGIPPHVEDALPPSPVSAFMNTRVGQDFITGQGAPAQDGRQPLRVDLDGAINVKNWVLENISSFTAEQPHGFSRGDIRIVHDEPRPMIRFAAGDLAYPVSTYQRFRPMAGITAASNFSLQPYRVTVPTGTSDIFLKRPSRVVVYVNGAQTQVLHLPAGRHDLRNLALANGVNFIRLEITDDVGHTEIVTFPWVSNAELLARHLHQFAYSVGVPSTQVDNHREYDRSMPTVSLFHRYGLSDASTIGANFQGDHLQRVAGLEWLQSTTLGTFGVEPALSYGKSAGSSALPGYAVRFRYLYTDYLGPRETQRNLELGADYRGNEFTLLGDTGPSTLARYVFSGSYSQSLVPALSARVGGVYELNRETQPGIVNSRTISTSLVYSFASGMQASATLTQRITPLDQKENSAFLLLTWMIPGTNNYFNASHDTGRRASRAEWRYNSPQLVGGYNPSLSFERAPDANRLNASLDYTGNRGIVSVIHDRLTNWSGTGGQTTSLRAGFGIAFAGGRFALGRPITNSFTLIAPTEHLRGQTIDVNPNAAEYHEARADWLGPGLLPSIRPYQYYNLYLDPSRLEPGFELGQENYVLSPTYKSGTLIRAGTGATIMLDGVLTDAKDKPLSLVSGEARRLGGAPNEKPVFLFTNRKGRFRLEGFHPGTYELKLFDDSHKPVVFTIPERAAGIYPIGRLRLE